MRIIHLTVEIKIDDLKIRKLYPDFDAQFEDINDFENTIYENITSEADSLENLGYSVTIKDNTTVVPINYSLN